MQRLVFAERQSAKFTFSLQIHSPALNAMKGGFRVTGTGNPCGWPYVALMLIRRRRRRTRIRPILGQRLYVPTTTPFTEPKRLTLM